MAQDHRPAGGVWTYEEYAKLPDVEGVRYEIIAGDLYISRTPPLLHAVVLASFMFEMFGWVERHGLGKFLPGPLNVLFADGDFVLPDFIFIRRDRRAIVTERAVEGVPDLIVECVAPETRERDRGLKRERYALYGVPEYWVIDAENRAMEIYRHDGSGYAHPVRVTDRWIWQPIAGGPVLELNLPELLEDYDRTGRIIEENEQRSADRRRPEPLPR